MLDLERYRVSRSSTSPTYSVVSAARSALGFSTASVNFANFLFLRFSRSPRESGVIFAFLAADDGSVMITLGAKFSLCSVVFTSSVKPNRRAVDRGAGNLAADAASLQAPTYELDSTFSPNSSLLTVNTGAPSADALIGDYKQIVPSSSG